MAGQTVPMEESMSMSAGHLESITTRDTVETRVGALEFREGAPTADTAQPLDHRLDFVRGGEALRSIYQDASVDCMRNELLSVGGEEDQLP
jgi:hypothetical protein